MSHSWEHKKLGTSYSETTHLFGLKLWLQGVLMRAPCCRSFKSNRCLVSEYEVSNFLGSRKWDIFSGPPCTSPDNCMQQNARKDGTQVAEPAPTDTRYKGSPKSVGRLRRLGTFYVGRSQSLGTFTTICVPLSTLP